MGEHSLLALHRGISSSSWKLTSMAKESGVDSVEVSVLQSCLLHPHTPTPSHHLFLSSLDLFWRDFHYNRRLLFYSLPFVHQSSSIDTLKSSLSNVLVHFFPAAGRLALVDGRTFIYCNDQGVEFVEAAVDATLDQLHASNFQPGPLFNKLVPWETHELSNIYSIPLLSIQVTRFSCGGLAVGYAHSHVLADGHSMWHFMNSWAECARKETVSIQPLHMRAALKVDNPSEDEAFLDFPPADSSAEGQVGAAMPIEPLVERVFHFTPQMINKLKQEATLHDLESRFSTYEVLCAHMWKRITKARELEASTLVRLGIIANMRNRITPELPYGYFGNAVFFCSVFATAGEVGEEELGKTATRVNGGVNSCNEAKMRGMMQWLELHDNTFGSMLQNKAPSVKAASSPRFAVYGVDFGWGKPVAVRAGKVKGDGEMVLFPGREEEGGVVMCLPLNSFSMTRLLNDPCLFP